ncbi:MAG: RluA family pseudouridine synthase [Prevotella sp.]|nr:RluA family pseudouridine synthase [Prevotella sp.]
MTFHPLHTDVDPPSQMNNPFDYEPHPLCKLAAAEVQVYIYNKVEWREEVAQGKMFGVLVVEDSAGTLGYLAAYSGQILGRSDWDGFVPAVFDYLKPNGFFKQHEAEIDAINREVERLEASDERRQALKELEELRRGAEKAIEQKRNIMTAAKMLRDQRRREAFISEAERAEMLRESQFLKAELHRTKKRFSDEIEEKERKIKILNDEIEGLKRLRRERSDTLQRWLFSQFEMLNAQGEKRNLLQIFSETASRIPPAGAGECCEPKLLQYAYQENMRPLCIAMFWFGDSPKTEIRRHGLFYPACSGKCKPILQWMIDLKSLPKVHGSVRNEHPPLDIVYEDDALLVVNKPAGLLSVPGIDAPFSVYSIFRELYPDLETPGMVHRLDMATSGLLLIAKTKSAHKDLQNQFAERTVRKRYAAILDGELDAALPRRGTISLPLGPDLLDRPRQLVDHEHGKLAVTTYIINKVEAGKTWLSLYPKTGRTHQLRVHCAHQDGLNCPILGDVLYGTKADRLYLHAEYIEFTHPETGRRMRIEAKAPF